MSARTRNHIPQTLDEPEKVAFWTVDEFIILIGAMGTGIVLGYFVTGILAGFIGVHLIKRFKKGESLNRVRLALYWYAPSWLFAFKATLSSYKRELAG